MSKGKRMRQASLASVILFCACSWTWAEEDKVRTQALELNNAASYHEQFCQDAERRVDVSVERKAAVAELRKAVDELNRCVEGKRPAAEVAKVMDAANAKLTAAEAFLPEEGIRIARTEDLEEANALLPLIKDAKVAATLKSRLAEMAGEAKKASSASPEFRRRVDGVVTEVIRAADGWQPGVSTLSFGRFGRSKTDGLLCDTVAFNSIKTDTEAQQLGRVTSADMEISTAGCDVTFPETTLVISVIPKDLKSVNARVTKTNWIGKTLAISSADKKDLGAILTTLERPATRFNYQVPRVWCGMRGCDPGKTVLHYEVADGWHQTDLSVAKTITAAEMKRPWVLLDLFDPGRHQRVLLVLQVQKKIKSIDVSPEGLVLTAEGGALGNMWVFRPEGIHRRKVEDAFSPKSPLAERIDRLCGLHLAWPTECREFFRVNASDETIAIRNEVDFDVLKDEWGTKPLKETAIPPLVMLAKRYQTPVTISGKLTTWDLPTKYGHFATVEGSTLEYTIPSPPLYRHGLFVVDTNKEVVDLITRSLEIRGAVDGSAPDWAFRGSASARQAGGYMNAESRKALDAQGQIIKTNLEPAHFWKIFKWRMEPLTGRRYCYEYPGGFYRESYVNDIDWDNTLVFYGLDQWAARQNHWKELEAAWPNVALLQDYLVKSHDWAWMADCITEMGEGAAIDCLTAVYAGEIAAVRMARTLGDDRFADRALYISAKTALTHTLRFAFLEYVQKYDMWHTDSPGQGTVNGFHEYDAFIHPKHSAPWWGVCSLSGFGVEPECYDAILFYIGRERMKKWWDMVTSIYPEWFDGSKAYPPDTLYGGNSMYVTTPGIYLEFRLGADDSKLMSLIKKAGYRDGFYQNPNAFGEILSRQCPVQFADWGQCTFDPARYDPKTGQAEAVIVNNTAVNQTVTLSFIRMPEKSMLDGKAVTLTQKVDRWKTQMGAISIGPGSHKLEMVFKTQ